jgi:DNA repair exonuclease SbcCD ATPase subunit
LLAAILLLAGADSSGQQADRERAQMLQLQQQLQRLQSDNASLQKERGALESKAQETDKLKKESESTGKALAQARQQATSQGKELADLRAQLADATAKLNAARNENEALRKAVADRNDALAAAAADKRRGEAAQALLATRLKVQTGRGDLCEQRHEGLMKFSGEVIDRYEADRLRWCEPVTGIWKVREQTKMQGLRDELYGYRLDIPAPVLTKSLSTPAGK